MKYDSVTIIGPTASGKTGRAVGLASLLHGEVISADSRQVYVGMDLGTGKDLHEYEDVPYHLIDICKAGSKYNLHLFLRDFHNAYSGCLKRGVVPIVCGGTGMYVETALAGIELPDVPVNMELRIKYSDYNLEELTNILMGYKTLHNSTDVDTVKRAIRAIEIEEYYLEHPEQARKADRSTSNKLKSLIIGIDIPREERRKRITARLHQRLSEGMVEEIESLIKSGIDPDDLIYYGLEYKYVTLHVIGKLTKEEMFNKLEMAIHQFSKRQMTWFRGMEKRGFNINWLPYDMPQTEFNENVIRLLS